PGQPRADHVREVLEVLHQLRVFLDLGHQRLVEFGGGDGTVAGGDLRRITGEPRRGGRLAGIGQLGEEQADGRQGQGQQGPGPAGQGGGGTADGAPTRGG